MLALLPNGQEVRRYDDVIPVQGTTGDLEALALYAGTGVGNIDSVEMVNTVMARLLADTEEALSKRDDV